MREQAPETRYLTLADGIAIHEAVMLRTSAGYAPLRDDGLLESALTRPRMAAYYEGADIVRQAALLAIAVSQAQEFVDGNKRAAYACTEVFLTLNGLWITGHPIDLAKQLESVASRSDDLTAATARFEAWLRQRVESIGS